MLPGPDSVSTLVPGVLSRTFKDEEEGGDRNTAKAAAQPSGKRSPGVGAEGSA